MSSLSVRKACIFSLCMSVVVLHRVTVSRGQEAASTDYARILRSVITTAAGSRSGGVATLPSSISLDEPIPRFRPVEGLDNSAALSFLCEVLANGPGWREDDVLFKHSACAEAYAALCLGAIGDSRAFAPLLTSLTSGNTTRYMKTHAAIALGYLGDARAIQPLTSVLKSAGLGECAYALVMLEDVNAFKTILDFASSQNAFRGNMNVCLQYLMRVHIRPIYSAADQTYTFLEFPDLGKLSRDEVYARLWRHLMDGGGEKYARQQFNTYHSQWVDACRQKPGWLLLHKELEAKMLAGGAFVLPCLLEHIGQGDDSLIPLVAEMTKSKHRKPRTEPSSPTRPFEMWEHRYALSRGATRAECLDWWEKNKGKWLVFKNGR